MGTAIANGMIKNAYCQAAQITIIDPSAEKRSHLAKSLGVNTSENNESCTSADLIILAVKPQVFPELAQALKEKVHSECTVLSIMAGIDLMTISTVLDHKNCVRCMPNTPALVNKGSTSWFANETVQDVQKEQVQKLLESFGKAHQLETEEQLDDITALSGSGPGFFFEIFDAWHSAAKELNVSEELSKQILTETLEGSLELLKNSSEEVSTLRDRVTSKGGTTAAGLNELEKGNLRLLMNKMISAAKNRCQELRDQNES